MKLFFHNLGTFAVLKPSVLFSSEVNVVIDRCTFCFTSKLKFVFKPPRLLCSFVICEFPLMGDCSGKIWYLVSDVPQFTISRMNDLTSEFNSRKSVGDAPCFKALTVSGIVLYC